MELLKGIGKLISNFNPEKVKNEAYILTETSFLHAVFTSYF
jgi:hypothetical protein